MSLRYLIGPVGRDRAAEWDEHRQSGRCLAFGLDGADVRLAPRDSWDDLLARLPTGWRPDFVALDLAYTSVPPCLWQAPVPLVALAHDWPLQWHFLRLALPLCALVFTDARGVEVITRQGLAQARPLHLFGLQGLFTRPPAGPAPNRDIDILFVGNLHPAVQRKRLPWLARLAALAARWRVVIRQGVRGEAYRDLLRRARVVFNRSARGEWNLRVAEACSCGALLFQEAGNPEMTPHWRHGEDCVFYDEATLESLLEHYLNHEEERACVAEAGKSKVGAFTLWHSWLGALEQVEREWPAVQTRHAERVVPAGEQLLLLRSWQALGAADAGDPTLIPDLDAALSRPDVAARLHTARGVLEALGPKGDAGYSSEGLRRAARHFERAVGKEPQDAASCLGLVEALAGLNARDLAVQGARRVLASLLAAPLNHSALDTPVFPPDYDFLRVEWERAAWANAGRPLAEREAKTTLLRWRLHALLASLTDDPVHFGEAAVARPDLPTTRAALGCALGRAGRPAEAAAHLLVASRADPFDLSAARAGFQALRDAGQEQAARDFALGRRLLHLASPARVPVEPWFAPSAVPVAAGALAVAWEGAFLAQHSLGHVNRRLCLGLLARGHELSLRDVPSPGPQVEPGPDQQALEARLGKTLSRPPEVTVRHAWPPDVTPPAQGCWVLVQPWEYFSVPKDWVEPIVSHVDEVWVPSSYVRAGFVASGVPADRVHVIAQGADAGHFQPGLDPLPLPTAKRFKFLFVGCTIHRKGIDVLLDAYARAFRASDDVALVIKDMGRGTFYKGQTAEALIDRFRCEPTNPAVVYLDAPLSEGDLPRLYAACDCLAAPYRGEGFGLPIAEAMSCGLPVVVTNHGAALDFVDETVGWLVPAQVRRFPERRVGDLETADFPQLAEPDVQALAAILRQVFDRPEERQRRGRAGRERVLARLTWEHSVTAVDRRLRELRQRPARRLQAPTPHPEAVVHGHRMALHEPVRDRWVSAVLLAGQPYEPFETEVILRQVRAGDHVVDLGANVGYYTLLLARAVGPAGQVYAFEPDPDNFALLRRNVESNGYTNVVLVNKAAANHSGTARLYQSGDNQGDHRLYPSPEGRPGVEVEAVRLDDFFGESPPRLSVVKMDIQGAEGLALTGMTRLLAGSPAVQLVSEFWPLGLRRAGGSAADFLARLEGLGFSLFVIDEPRQQLLRAAPAELLRIPEHEDAFTNLLCVRPVPAEADRPVYARAAPLKPGVSLCVIARDEEHNIAACLDSAAGLFAEVVVVDTGSADRTKEIARAKGAQVYDFPWVDNFSAARNACLDHATCEWIFWLDADDRLDEDNREKLRDLFASLPEGNVAYALKCRCLPDPQTGTATVVDHVRLFRNHPAIRWTYRVHEQILGAVKAAGGTVEFADVTVQHTGYVDADLRRRKLLRDLRLLELEDRERPNEPFVAFNLGATYLELGRHQAALPRLEHSLARSHPNDSIVRKLYALIAACRLHAGDPEGALRVIADGLRVCPDDAELLLLEGGIRAERGDLAGARTALTRLLGTEAGPHFASVSEGLRTFRGRHALAGVCSRLGEHAQAETHWRACLAEAPAFLPGWLGLADLLLAQRRWPELDEACVALERLPGGEAEAAVLRVRTLLARREFGAARAEAEAALTRWPDALVLRNLLCLSYLEEDQDHAAAEALLLDVLQRDPDNAQARRNLEVLRHRLGRAQDAVFEGEVALEQLYRLACAAGSDVAAWLPRLRELAARCDHVTEFGTGSGQVTAALLHAQPARLVSYDRLRHAQVDRLLRARGRTHFAFRQEDVLWAIPAPTELLVIDTKATFEQLSEELRLHAGGVSKYIAVARTAAFRDHGEDQGSVGLWPALDRFLAPGEWRVLEQHGAGCGLTVLERAGPAAGGGGAA